MKHRLNEGLMYGCLFLSFILMLVFGTLVYAAGRLMGHKPSRGFE